MIKITSVKSSIGIITHQGHIRKVNANADLLSESVTHITSIASCDANITNGHLHSMLINVPSSKMWAECQSREHILHPALDIDTNVKHVETN